MGRWGPDVQRITAGDVQRCSGACASFSVFAKPSCIAASKASPAVLGRHIVACNRLQLRRSAAWHRVDSMDASLELLSSEMSYFAEILSESRTSCCKFDSGAGTGLNTMAAWHTHTHTYQD